jgi:hypothetical protein
MIAVAVIIYVAPKEKGRISGRERPSYWQRKAVLLIIKRHRLSEVPLMEKENLKNQLRRNCDLGFSELCC